MNHNTPDHHPWDCDCFECEWLDQEAERRAAERRGTPECDGLCAPICDWCLAAHDCPEQCGGGAGCPYEGLARQEARHG